MFSLSGGLVGKIQTAEVVCPKIALSMPPFTFSPKAGIMESTFSMEGSALRWLENKIDRFCIEHPRFGISNLMLYVAVANVAIYLLDTFSLGGSISAYLEFSRYDIFHGQIWRLVTFALLPPSGDFLFFKGSGIFFVVLSAYFYFWIGSLLEREWGTARFSVFYLGGVILNIVYGLITDYASMYYINLSMFFAFAILFPDMQVLLFYILPVKVKWLAWIDAALFAWDVISCLLVLNIVGALLPIVAILNFFIFFWSDITERLGYRRQRYQHQHSKQTVNFKKAVKTIYQEKGYIHKCAVCGKTDTEFPDMEFRYCSKCNGNYCYCSEHINDHEHIQ